MEDNQDNKKSDKQFLDFGDFFEKIEQREKYLQEQGIATQRKMPKPDSGFSLKNFWSFGNRRIKIELIVLVLASIGFVILSSYLLFNLKVNPSKPDNYNGPPAMPVSTKNL